MVKIFGILSLCCMAGLAGCASGISQEEYANLESNYSVLKDENGDLENQVYQLQEKLDGIEQEYNDYKKRAEQDLAEARSIATKETETTQESVPPEESMETQNEESETEKSEKTWNLSELKIDGELITESTVTEMVEGYDYITDVHIEVNESRQEISITVQVISSASVDTAKMAGEDVARYFAAQASWSTNSYRDYKTPGSNDFGSLYGRYNLLLYVDDGNNGFNLYGAKATTANSIIWR